MTPPSLILDQRLAVLEVSGDELEWARSQRLEAGDEAVNRTRLAETGESKSASQTRHSLIQIAGARINDLSGIISQLLELRQECNDDEFGVLRPTDVAFEDAVSLLIDTAILMWVEAQRQIPHGCASSDSEGGIRIEWVRPGMSVHLAIPSRAEAKKRHIYHENEGSFGVDPSVTPRTLADWLRRLDD